MDNFMVFIVVFSIVVALVGLGSEHKKRMYLRYKLDLKRQIEKSHKEMIEGNYYAANVKFNWYVGYDKIYAFPAEQAMNLIFETSPVATSTLNEITFSSYFDDVKEEIDDANI